MALGNEKTKAMKMLSPAELSRPQQLKKKKAMLFSFRFDEDRQHGHVRQGQGLFLKPPLQHMLILHI